jgi:uncharacterized membrane protein
MNKRIWELDFLRGFAIIMMVFDHLMYDFMYLPNYFSNYHSVDNSVFNFLNELGYQYWISDLRFFGHFFFVSVFLIVSGISFTFSKNNLSRGLKLAVVALLITLVTYGLSFLISGVIIVFGIIHLYALSIIIIYFLRKIIKNELVLLVIALAIIAYGIIIKFYHPFYIGTFTWAKLPDIIIGLRAYGADHFGLVPYLGIIILGTVLGNTFYKNKVSLIPSVKMSEKNIFSIAGRRSLLIFVTHQVVLILLIYIIGYIFGYRF